MKYLLDTCTVSDFVRGHPQVLRRMKSMRPKRLAVSALTVMEIAYGLARNRAAEERVGAVLRALLETLHCLDFTAREAHAAASIRADLERRGLPIGAYDLLIAATAQSRDLTVVTSNVGEFARIPELAVEDWREASTA